MAFPQTPLQTLVELSLGGTWTDITSYVYTDNGISITRGRPDESSSLSPSSCRLQLNNRDGRFSPRNPVGAYYGLIGRNTPLRVSTQLGSVRLVSPTNIDYASTSDSAGLSITGDIDLRIDARVPSWTRGEQFITKFASIGQYSYVLSVTTAGLLRIGWSTDGTTVLARVSTIPLQRTTGRQAIRATLDVDNGAAGHTVTFYYADSMSSTWIQLGDPVVTAGTTSIFDSTSFVASALATGTEVYSLKILQGIGGTERANPDFTAQADGATSFTDAAGNTWALVNGARITSRRYRFYGEVSSWPQTWDVSGTDVRVAVEASGVARRLAQSDPLLGPIQRAAIRNAASLVAYWPMDDEDGSTSLASGLSGGPSMALTGAPRLATNSTLFPASNPLPEIGLATFGGPALPVAAASGFLHFRCLLGVPAAGEGTTGIILRAYTSGTAAIWDLILSSTGGGLTLRAYDAGSVQLFSQGVGFQVVGRPVVAGFELTQNGANVDWRMFTTDYDPAGAGTLQWTQTLTAATFGSLSYLQVNPNNVLDKTVIGHVTAATNLPTVASYVSPLRGWAGETAGRRVERLCSEEAIAFQGYGDLDQSTAMGIQPAGTLLDLLGECEASDLGQVFESREILGLAYRTRDSRQYQMTALALDYGNLSELTPLEDDQHTRNDVTASRIGGSSARVTVDTGTLSTQAPPNGVGRYAETDSLSLYLDSQCADQASIRASIGTIDEPRYPTIEVHLETAAFAVSTALTDAALGVEHGDLITITGTPSWLPPDTIRQHTVGRGETLSPFGYEIGFVCTPATPIGSSGLYDVLGRYSPSGSTLTANITSVATGAAALSITTAAGNPLWTTNVADFPLDILVGGERITLSAISGTTSPQSATVSARSVNGVVKSQTAGAAIDIADPSYYSF